MNIRIPATYGAQAIIAMMLISTPAIAINTDLPGVDDDITRIAQSSETIDEKDNYYGMPVWAVNKIDDQLYTFRIYHYQSFFLITPEGVIVSDPNTEEMATLMVREIRKLTDKPIKLVIYSHDHWDHTIGAQAFRKEGATILAHETTAISMREMNARWPNPKALLPDLTWSGDRYAVKFGGTDLELHYYGKDHGSGMVFYYFPNRKILHAADIISPNRLPSGPMPDMRPTDILRTLNEVAKLDFTRVISSHEPWVLFPRSAVDDMAEFYADMFVSVDEAIAKFEPGPAPWAVVAVVKPNPKYETWYKFKEWWAPVTTRFVIERLLGW